MKQEMVCIICPRGCALTVEQENDELRITGNACKRGATYATEELTHPTRNISSTIRVANLPDTMVSVKTERPIPKEMIFSVMQEIRSMVATAPIKRGDVLFTSTTGIRIVATTDISLQ